MKRLILIMLLLAACNPAKGATIVRLQEGTTANGLGMTSDGYILDSYPYGKADIIALSVRDTASGTSVIRRFLLRADSVAKAIPVGATIVSAVCSLRTNGTSSGYYGDSSIWIYCYRIHDFWDADSNNLDATGGYHNPPWWNGRKKVRVGGVEYDSAWSDAGCNIPNSSYATKIDSQLVTTATNTWYHWHLLPSDVQAWLDSSGAPYYKNQGLMFKGNEVGYDGSGTKKWGSPERYFHSSNYTDNPAYQPILSISYVVAGTSSPRLRRIDLMGEVPKALIGREMNCSLEIEL